MPLLVGVCTPGYATHSAQCNSIQQIAHNAKQHRKGPPEYIGSDRSDQPIDPTNPTPQTNRPISQHRQGEAPPPARPYSLTHSPGDAEELGARVVLPPERREPRPATVVWSSCTWVGAWVWVGGCRVVVGLDRAGSMRLWEEVTGRIVHIRQTYTHIHIYLGKARHTHTHIHIHTHLYLSRRFRQQQKKN